jgi:hypothetical protein
MNANCCKSCKDASNNTTTCVDTNQNCAAWASRGECQKNPGYMLKNCCKSCK